MKKNSEPIDWHSANQENLLASINLIRVELENYRSLLSDQNESFNYSANLELATERYKQSLGEIPSPSAIDNLCTTFGLSDFERNMLLLAAGIELDSEFESIISSIQGAENFFLPTLSLALSTLPNAHWSAISPSAPLRYWNLIKLNVHQSITKSSYSIDEQILNYLVGLPHMNESLFGIMDPYIKTFELVPSQLEVVEQIQKTIPAVDETISIPALQLFGDELHDKLSVTAHVCQKNNAMVYIMSPYSVPDTVPEILELSRRWNREIYLGSAALFLDCSEIDTNDSMRLQRITRFCENISGLFFIGCKYWAPQLKRKKQVFHINKPTSEEQLTLWQKELGENASLLDGHLTRLVSQFSLSTQSIHEASADILGRNLNGELKGAKKVEYLNNELWQLCCKQSRPRLDDLAQRIKCISSWDDIVLPEMQMQTLREVASHVKQRVKVYEEWGWGKKNARGLGISVLFTGESGTGKTMSSEILAKELNLDLYRIDLSQVVNKYIGETEKNLKKVFDAAEAGGAVLLFDEADALFGKRSEVKDSHDRYANIEVSYLLQRMEAYRGLAILTTNLKSAMDKAFLRRIRFTVHFPFPDVEQRAEIWRRIFPKTAPVDNIDINRLARLNIAGGNIQNIALNAAFIAAENDSAIRTEHIEKAARFEYAKLEKPMSIFEKNNMY